MPMNVKAESVGTGKATDVALLVLAVLIVAAGVAAYYLLPQVASGWRMLIVLGSIAVAFGVTWFTALGKSVGSYLRETQFELRKVVWPTRDETLRTTLVVILVVVLLSIVLGLIDIILKWAILDNLLKL